MFLIENFSSWNWNFALKYLFYFLPIKHRNKNFLALFYMYLSFYLILFDFTNYIRKITFKWLYSVASIIQPRFYVISIFWSKLSPSMWLKKIEARLYLGKRFFFHDWFQKQFQQKTEILSCFFFLKFYFKRSSTTKVVAVVFYIY